MIRKIRTHRFDSNMNINVIISTHKERLRIENNIGGNCPKKKKSNDKLDVFISTDNDYVFVELEADDDYIFL